MSALRCLVVFAVDHSDWLCLLGRSVRPSWFWHSVPRFVFIRRT
jgi:hypothetical protein